VFEPDGIDGVGFRRQPVAARLAFDRPLRQRLAQPGHQALQGIRRVGRQLLTPDPIDERRLRHDAPGFEGEGDQQCTQPGTRHVGHGAVVRANLERSQYPDLHQPIFSPSRRQGRAGWTGLS